MTSYSTVEHPSSPSPEECRWRLSHSLIHEMRSVITSVKIAGEVLGSERGEDRDARRNYAGLIAEQTGRVGRLLEDFSELVRPEAGRGPRGEEVADLNVALDQARRELVGLARQLGVDLELSPSTYPALAPGEQGRVTQAVRALLEHLMVTVPRGSVLGVDVVVPAQESEVVTVVYTCRQPAAAQEPTVALDWGRIGLGAARRIVERQGGSILASEATPESPLTVCLPRLRATSRGVARPPAESYEPVRLCLMDEKVA